MLHSLLLPWRCIVVSILISLAPPPVPVAAQGCSPDWVPAFEGLAGVGAWDPSTNTASIQTLQVFDDGNGPALYAAGKFMSAGGSLASNIARWDGSDWDPLGGGVGSSDSTVHALGVFNDGGGPAIYAGGSFTTAGGIAAQQVAKWNGQAWSALGTGLNDTVHALLEFDDGSGTWLYAGGLFTLAGGAAASRIAKWNGSVWAPLGTGIAGSVSPHVADLVVFDDGTGPALYAAGEFNTAGGVTANSIAKWNGASWSALGAGLVGKVNDLIIFDDGTGSALYAAGSITSAGGVPVTGVAKWDGITWSALGATSAVSALAVFDDGSGPALIAASFAYIRKWDGFVWTTMGLPQPDAVVHAFATFTGPASPMLIAAGKISTGLGELGAQFSTVLKWTGTAWVPISDGLNGSVRALTVFDDGSGEAMYAGGLFSKAGSAALNGVGRWNGWAWAPVGGYGQSSQTFALASFDDGKGPALYAGGQNAVKRWDGVSWTELGSGISGGGHFVSTLAVFDDGSGPALFAAGDFTKAGGVLANRIARWAGSTWSPLGTGLNDSVWAMAVYDDGGGPALYVGGEFTTAGGVAASGIAKWDGTSWSALGGGVSGAVLALTSFTDAGGHALYVGGAFPGGAGFSANNLARWNGSTWSGLGSGLNDRVRALHVFDDGQGEGQALYVGGDFTMAGSVAANGIIKWTGLRWISMGAGVSGTDGATGIHAIAEFDDGSGPALIVGGVFHASPAEDSLLAKWGCALPPSPWVDLGGGLWGEAYPHLTGSGSLIPGSSGAFTLSGGATPATGVFFIAVSSTPAPFKCGILVPVPIALQLPLIMAGGSQSLRWVTWPAGLSGLHLYFQYALADVFAPCGVSISNALLAIVP